jgi:nanoRNase/pAp phosphatase (c-di-AMP/oligoRNAs hydrolase)
LERSDQLNQGPRREVSGVGRRQLAASGRQQEANGEQPGQPEKGAQRRRGSLELPPPPVRRPRGFLPLVPPGPGPCEKRGMANEKYRLVTRSDFDGLVCAVLLKELEMIDEIVFVHPKDMQDGKIEITGRDITTNLPYVPGAYLAFDHHHSETLRVGKPENYICKPDAPSAARVVYDHFGGKATFPSVGDDIMLAVDQGDSAAYTEEEILNPKGWALLNFIMDARTGLGRFRNFRISNYDLMMELINACRVHTIEQILELPDVEERVDLYFEQHEKFKDQIKRCSTAHENLVVLDLRNEKVIFPGNRFMIYALFPECNISIHVISGKQNQNTVFAVGKSILKKDSRTDVGELMLTFGGGGHVAAGTCQVDNDKAAETLEELIDIVTQDG